MKRCFSSPEHEKVALQLRWSGRSESEATLDGHTDAGERRPGVNQRLVLSPDEGLGHRRGLVAEPRPGPD
jgi:hypothetical protein